MSGATAAMAMASQRTTTKSAASQHKSTTNEK